MASTALVSILVLAFLVGIPAAAEAGGVKIIIGGGQRVHHFHHHTHPHGPAVSGVHAHSLQAHPHHHVIILRSAPPCRFIPGQWTHQWIPQSYTYHVWVPGHWSSDGVWIEGHYEPRMVSTGYYQPVWVAGYCVQ